MEEGILKCAEAKLQLEQDLNQINGTSGVQTGGHGLVTGGRLTEHHCHHWWFIKGHRNQFSTNKSSDSPYAM